MRNSFRGVATLATVSAVLAATAIGAAPAGAATVSLGTPPLPLLDGLLGPLAGTGGEATPAAPATPSQGGTLLSRPRRHGPTSVPVAHIKSRRAVRVFRGRLVSVDRDRERLVVALRRGRRGMKKTRVRAEFLVGGARIRVRDHNGDGNRDLHDLRRGDQVKLKALVGLDAASAGEPLQARLVVDRSPRRPVSTLRRSSWS